jgi:two-component system chemotaxis response regulator CheY
MAKTALVVDDSASIRQMVAFTLMQAGFTVLEGADGADALARLSDLPSPGAVNLVITDLNMPVMDGITLIRQLRARPASKFTPILLLTTESAEARKQEGRAAGATGWIIKPFNPEQLLQIVAKIVR